MRNRFIILAVSAIVSVVASSPAFACKFVQPQSEAERISAANATVSTASVIMDAEVIRPSNIDGKPALLKAINIVKGSKRKKFFLVSGMTSCDHQFRETGSRQRVLLFGGPKLYRASMYASSAGEIDRAIAAMPNRKR